MTSTDASSESGVEFALTRWPEAVLVDLTWPDGRELIMLAIGRVSVAVTAIDQGDQSHGEPRVYVVPKPIGLDPAAPDEEIILMLWQIMGEVR